MFSPLGAWRDRNIFCPAEDECNTPHCIFKHRSTPNPHQIPGTPEAIDVAPQAAQSFDPPAKRQKLNSSQPAKAPAPFIGQLLDPQRAEKKSDPSQQAPGVQDALDKPDVVMADAAERQHIASATQRPVSPPEIKRPSPADASTRAKTATAGATLANRTLIKTTTPQKDQQIALNPRKLDHPPAKHEDRYRYAKKLYETMVPLNKKVEASTDPSTKALQLTDSQLITLALDEEEQKARGSKASVYGNAIKLLIVHYMRMSLDKWKEERLKDKEGKKAAPPETANGSATASVGGVDALFEAELTPSSEIYILRRLAVNQLGLDRYGYITAVPSEDKVKETERGVQLNHNWEVCARCETRFQVFPERREEDGAVTTGGKCTYHWGRATLEARDVSKVREKVWSCCYEAKGATRGCIEAESHVYKVSDANRLHLAMPFVKTPPNPNAPKNLAISFDCEMGYTTKGTELLRLSALSCPQNEVLLDVLVRPLGVILDLNTRFSGVSAEQFASAQPFDETQKEMPKGQGEHLQIVESPYVARKLFLDMVSPETPLIGHAIENDLNAIRLVHPTIIDTIILYPHKMGLPMRNSLKQLSFEVLKRPIQIAGAAGHDSKEDAVATSDLVRVKVARKWREMKNQGWTIQDGELVPPKFPR